MDTTIKISVIMPIYNGEKYLHQAIDSMLSQTFKDFELIAINDGSSDQSVEILKSYNDPRIVIINNTRNQGLIRTLNIGINNAHGKYVARLDQDDIALPKRLEVQYNFLENHPKIDLVGSWTECIDTTGKILKISRNPADPVIIRYELLFNNVMFHSSIFFRTDVIKKNGGYDERDPIAVHSEDYEMYSRPGKELRCANIPEVLFKLRLHGESIVGNPTSQITVHKNSLNVAYRNISQYIPLPHSDFETIKDILIIKKPNQTISCVNFSTALRTLRSVTREFIKKNNLSAPDSEKVLAQYRGRKWMLWKHYIIGKYHKVIKINYPQRQK